MRRSYCYRLYPTRRQALALEVQLGQACDLYNAALQHRGDAWREHGRSVSYGAQSAELRELRREELLDGGANLWYVTVCLVNVRARPLARTGRSVGLDVGITTFAATSDGELIAGPRAGRAAASAVRRAQRKVARRKRGSYRRRKGVALLARQREREANVRRDHAHKAARPLIERYDTICVEDLNYRGLAKGTLARDCNDQGWSRFAALLGEKAEDAARRVLLVDARNTSQTCSACGALVLKTLALRVHSCACGYVADRDVNAARNVLARGLGPDGAVRHQRWGEQARAVA